MALNYQSHFFLIEKHLLDLFSPETRRTFAIPFYGESTKLVGSNLKMVYLGKNSSLLLLLTNI